jgi:hypothetical protein
MAVDLPLTLGDFGRKSNRRPGASESTRKYYLGNGLDFKNHSHYLYKKFLTHSISGTAGKGRRRTLPPKGHLRDLAKYRHAGRNRASGNAAALARAAPCGARCGGAVPAA